VRHAPNSYGHMYVVLFYIHTGSIGIVFWMGSSMSAALSTVGFSEPLLANLGKDSGNFLNVLPEGQVEFTLNR
jgi:hypothetical protein